MSPRPVFIILFNATVTLNRYVTVFTYLSYHNLTLFVYSILTANMSTSFFLPHEWLWHHILESWHWISSLSLSTVSMAWREVTCCRYPKVPM